MFGWLLRVVNTFYIFEIIFVLQLFSAYFLLLFLSSLTQLLIEISKSSKNDQIGEGQEEILLTVFGDIATLSSFIYI